MSPLRDSGSDNRGLLSLPLRAFTEIVQLPSRPGGPLLRDNHPCPLLPWQLPLFSLIDIIGTRNCKPPRLASIANKQVDNRSQPEPKPKTTTTVRVLQPARFEYTGANVNEAHQIQNKQVDNSSLYQTKPKTTRLQKRVSCGVVLMASTMLDEKCWNTVLQIGALGWVSLISYRSAN